MANCNCTNRECLKVLVNPCSHGIQIPIYGTENANWTGTVEFNGVIRTFEIGVENEQKIILPAALFNENAAHFVEVYNSAGLLVNDTCYTINTRLSLDSPTYSPNNLYSMNWQELTVTITEAGNSYQNTLLEDAQVGQVLTLNNQPRQRAYEGISFDPETGTIGNLILSIGDVLTVPYLKAILLGMLFLIAPLYSFAQNKVPQGNPNTQNQVKGGIGVDSVLQLPGYAKYPALDSCRRLWVQGDSILMFNDCTGGKKVLTIKDTTFIKSLIASSGGGADSAIYATLFRVDTAKTRLTAADALRELLSNKNPDATFMTANNTTYPTTLAARTFVSNQLADKADKADTANNVRNRTSEAQNISFWISGLGRAQTIAADTLRTPDGSVNMYYDTDNEGGYIGLNNSVILRNIGGQGLGSFFNYDYDSDTLINGVTLRGNQIFALRRIKANVSSSFEYIFPFDLVPATRTIYFPPNPKNNDTIATRQYSRDAIPNVDQNCAAINLSWDTLGVSCHNEADAMIFFDTTGLTGIVNIYVDGTAWDENTLYKPGNHLIYANLVAVPSCSKIYFMSFYNPPPVTTGTIIVTPEAYPGSGDGAISVSGVPPSAIVYIDGVIKLPDVPHSAAAGLHTVTVSLINAQYTGFCSASSTVYVNAMSVPYKLVSDSSFATSTATPVNIAVQLSYPDYFGIYEITAAVRRGTGTGQVKTWDIQLTAYVNNDGTAVMIPAPATLYSQTDDTGELAGVSLVPSVSGGSLIVTATGNTNSLTWQIKTVRKN